MEKETIFRKLRACGGRITAQRKILLDIILEEECVCCKEIYYKAIKKRPCDRNSDSLQNGQVAGRYRSDPKKQNV